MPLEDLNIITEEDKQKMSYGACVGGAALTGMAVGRIAGVQGLAAGGAVGAAIGLLSCKFLKEPIKRKLFGSNSLLSDHEIVAAMHSLRRQHPRLTKPEALDLLADVRREVKQNPKKYQRPSYA